MTDIRTLELEAAQAALYDWTGVAINTSLIDQAIASEPHLTVTAAEHGWDDGEVLDKLWAILCVTLLGIDHSEQAYRFHTDRWALADDVRTAHDRWVAVHPITS
ncbi:hypothetical protein ACGFIW_01310 [Micromonospora sp. NPDC048935]|uniref:hypothetical protein n=1 Tax=Micromonospora sp. NPDC048935 TaxID=3364262 RepID=UPI003719FCD3